MIVTRIGRINDCEDRERRGLLFCEEMPLRGKHAGRVWWMSGLMIEYRVTKNGVLIEGRQFLLWGVLMLPLWNKCRLALGDILVGSV